MARFYDVLEKTMEAVASKWSERLLLQITGNVLEVGNGTGRTTPYYPANVNFTGIEFSMVMAEIAKKKTEDKDNIKIMVMDAENMDFSDNSFEIVVTSCVFCSVPNPVKGLQEIRRICKPGGKILMPEHVRSQKKVIGDLMDAVNFTSLHLYGVKINRHTYENLLMAGFDAGNIHIENLWLDIVKL